MEGLSFCLPLLVYELLIHLLLSAQPNGLLQEYMQTWALYYVKFIKAYKESGVDIWGLTVQNEPGMDMLLLVCPILYTNNYSRIRSTMGSLYI